MNIFLEIFVRIEYLLLEKKKYFKIFGWFYIYNKVFWEWNLSLWLKLILYEFLEVCVMVCILCEVGYGIFYMDNVMLVIKVKF